ncbi:hypothetical protein ACS0OQ_04220 [Stenotrophomonas riyadhensis]|uniref:hypothetical protein n=1 Tax=Stenotrophomonas riyadhensis TaxID=2859893 RepID=UPI003F9B2036
MSNDNKTLAVDVLAVLHRMAGMALAMRESTRVDDARKGAAATEDDEAIAAVAELIEACGHLKRDATNERWAAFHAALARVKGEAA